MSVFKKFILESSIEIKATPDSIWDFFYHLQSNYKLWYPEEHQFFRWTKGKPLEVGSKFDSLEIVSGHKTRLKGKCVEAVKNEKIVFKPAWPASFMCTKLEWIIIPKENSSLFIAKTYYKFGMIFLKLKKSVADEIMAITKKHMDQEGINLKQILEK